jgi:sugar lactone lactonase YvrE
METMSAEIVTDASRVLRPGGWLIMELGVCEAAAQFRLPCLLCLPAGHAILYQMKIIGREIPCSRDLPEQPGTAMMIRRLAGVTLAALALGVALAGGQVKPRLLVELPAYAVTPDGMAIAPDGDLVVACPNFASYAKGAATPSVPGCFVKIGKDGRVRKWFDSPVLAETGRSCPMGIEFGPEGELYAVDNQNWGTGNGPNGEVNQGRILRLKIAGGKLAGTTVVAKGISHPNGLRYHQGQIYVTVSKLPKIKRPDGLMVSAVYRFPADGREIQVSDTLADPNLLVTFVTENRYAQYGADGIVFDSKGRLYVGNFGDGKIHRIVLDANGKVSENTIFARTDHDYSLDPAVPGFLAKAVKAKMRSTDGICVDKADNLYVADFSNNAIAKVTPAGMISVLAQNGDTGGRNGDLNEPGEPVVWQGRLVISNFDAVIEPDKVNQHHESPATMSVLELGEAK